MNKSIFIENVGSDWIIKRLGDDIFVNLQKLGYDVSCGQREEYKGEEICFHMWWRTAVPHKRATTNAVFVTHIDDIGKEHDLKLLKDKFDIFICMSEEDAKFLVELGFEEEKTFGIDLPVRNTYIKPLVFAIFSNCYSDNRKNEKWLLEYCTNNKNCNLINFLLIGHGWGNVGEQLNSLGSSFVWYNISRQMPSEYLYQQLALLQADYYLYMGMDGGAMGSYDAYALGLNLVISDDGYHKSIPDLAYTFSTKEEFNKCMDDIIAKQKRKLDFFESHSGQNYTRKLAYIFFNKSYPIEGNKQLFNYSVKEKRRNNYFFMTFHRIKQPFVTKYLKLLKMR